MSYDPFDELPDHIKELIKDMMKKIQDVNPDELENMMGQVFGKEFLDKLKDMQSSDQNFGFMFDPNMIKNFESLMSNFMNQTGQSFRSTPERVVVEEPYYEYTPIVENEGQLIVDLPGISDVRQVQWEIEENVLRLTAESEDAKFALEIPVKNNLEFRDMFASLKNSVFILPFRRK